jgi:hypothetical protein
MSNKSNSTEYTYNEDFKEPAKFTLNKFDFDLYYDEDNKIEKIIRVKRFFSKKNEKWKIYENNKTMFVIDGIYLNNLEKNFLRSIDGVNFLISQFKIGIKSFNALKNEIKKTIKRFKIISVDK